MKPLPKPALFACALLAAAALWPAPTSFCHAAEAAAVAAAATPDYKALVNGLFDRAATCEITGYIQEYRRHWFDKKVQSAESLGQLRQIFLQGPPRYLGTKLPESSPRSVFGLYLWWKDAQGRELGHLQVAEERDMLVLNDTYLFTTSTAGAQEKNVALMLDATAFACPELIAERKLPKPDYKATIEQLFAKAATCKITGDYYYMNDPTHEVNFSTSDAGTLRELKALFLSASPRFVVSKERPDEGAGAIRNLYFDLLDAQGKDVGHVSLLADDIVYFRPSNDLYCTTPADWLSGGNVTLMNLLGRFSLPEFYPRPKLPPAEDEAVKKKP